jgi:hypothetical protein
MVNEDSAAAGANSGTIQGTPATKPLPSPIEFLGLDDLTSALRDAPDRDPLLIAGAPRDARQAIAAVLRAMAPVTAAKL